MESNFLRKFVSLFEGTEVPDRFAVWAGVSCLSAMLERRIWIDMNIFSVYPNMFIVFVAEAGRMRKSTAAAMTRKLLSKTDPGPRMIAQKTTPEALIDALRVIRTDDTTALLQEQCGGIVVANELVTFINRDTYERGLGALMIELWDCPDKYEYRTRNRPTEEIHYGHLSLLGATTIHSLRDAIPLAAMGDGFTSRTVFVYVDKPATPVPRPIRSSHFKQTEQELILHLQGLSTLQGEVKFSADATEFFDAEYTRFYYSQFFDDPQFQAYASRRDKHLLKVGMCLMAAEGGGLELTAHHLQGAKTLLEDVEGNMRAVFDRIAMTESGSLTEEIYAAIRTSPGQDLPRSTVLRKFGHKLSAQDLQKVIETLVMQGRIKLDTSMDGKLHYKVEE
jgi:hypothetical protein